MKKDNGVPEDEENFEEAIKNVNTALNPTKVPHNALLFDYALRVTSAFASVQDTAGRLH